MKEKIKIKEKFRENRENNNKTKKKKIELIIAEKPKAALKIALALGKPNKKNFFGVPFYEVEEEDKKIIVASAVGHLFGVGEIHKSKKWPVFDVEWKPTYEISKQKYSIKYINALKKFNPDEITIACDYDIEGELIGYNVLRFIFNRKDAFRMKFSTLTKHDLLESYKNKLSHIDFNQAIAGETRHLLDWIYGINLSRLLMNSLVKKEILSIGRVQGPTLALVVNREKEIQNFKPKTFWKIFLVVKDSEGNKAILEYKEKIEKKEELENFKNLKNKEITLKIDLKNQSIKPFPPFNLSDLQMEAYKFYRLDPAKTLAIAQELYLAGLISYPRTSSQKLPPSIGYKIILEKILKKFGIEKNKLTRARPVEGRATDPAHPAIFPTGEYNGYEKLNREAKEVYNLIVKRFLACFAQDAVVEVKEIKTKIDGFEFKKNFKRIKEKGWLDIYPYKVEEEWSNIGENAIIVDLLVEEKQTQPPNRYNPASLVKELEKRNLGTKATRATIVETLYKRGYIKGKSIQVTPLGFAVENFLGKISPLILDESLTRKFELEMDKILVSDNPLEEERKIIEEAKEVIIKIVKDWEKNKEKLTELLSEAIKKLKEENVEKAKLIKCYKCDGFLLLKKIKKGENKGYYFVSCSNWPKCDVAINLPKFSVKKIDKKCKCGWPLLKVKLKNKKSFEICFNPNCEEFWIKKIKNKEKE